MKIGYKDLWIEINIPDCKNKIRDFLNKVFDLFPKEITIGLKLEDTDLVVERAILKISKKTLEEKLEMLPEKEFLANFGRFSRVSLEDIFEDKYIISSTGEKGWSEPEDGKCDLYILF